MAGKGRVKVGIIGSGFEADIHAASMGMVPDEIELVAVASPTKGHAAALAKRYNIPRVFTDYRAMLAEKDIEMVTITAPNSLHAQMTFDIAAAGKHVVCEKPLCMTLEEADMMIDVCRQQGRAASVCRGTVLYAQICQGQGDGRPGGVRQGVSGQAERKAFRAARRVVLGCEPIRRRRVHGYGLPRHRVLLLVPRAAEDQERAVPHGHACPCRQDPGRGRFDLHHRVRGRRGGTGRGQLGAARRHAGPHRSLRRRRLDRGGPAHGQRPADLQRVWLRLRRREGAHDQGLDLAGVRGTVELRLPAGDAAFCAVRARQGTAAVHRRGRPRGAGNPVRRVPIGGQRTKSCDLPFRASGGQTADRDVEEKSQREKRRPARLDG